MLRAAKPMSTVNMRATSTTVCPDSPRANALPTGVPMVTSGSSRERGSLAGLLLRRDCSVTPRTVWHRLSQHNRSWGRALVLPRERETPGSHIRLRASHLQILHCTVFPCGEVDKDAND